MQPASRPAFYRRLLIKTGKKFLRWNNYFQTKHSLIATTPKIDNSAFDWVYLLENNWREIRGELDI